MGSSLYQLYQEAEDDHIPVMWLSLRGDRSMAVQDENGNCIIGVDPWKLETIAEETVCIGHELGHCKTGSFYSPDSRFEIRKKLENRADRWAINRIVPESDFDDAIAEGHTDFWSLSEKFGVTEEFIKKAACLYTYGNLAAELYF